jgi:hypothetical protein
MQQNNYTITLTFGECAENHVGMQKIGKEVNSGFDMKELQNAKRIFEEKGFRCELISLSGMIETYLLPQANILIIRNGLNAFTEPTNVYQEQINLNHDKKAFMYGRVVNKTARYNLCFAETSQEPDYTNKKGRIISYESVPFTNIVRNNLHLFFGDKAKNLACEGNYYYDINKCGIGYHGDSERKIVIAIRLGASMPLYYQWYYQNEKVGDRIKLTLHSGDIYVMSEKATGNDWKCKSQYTLRHAAGCDKYT